MAEETTIALKVEIGGTEKTISNLKEMKEAMSALKKEQETLALGSQAFTDNQKKIDDLNQSLKSLSDSPALSKLKTALKEAQNAALNGDGKAAKRVAELQDEINDLKDSVTTFSGSGLEKARASFDMLKESFKNLDFGKLQIALKGLGSAFKALLPFAIIELVMYLKEHFEELSQGSGLLAKSLRFVADIISQIGDGLNWLTDNLKLTNTALDEMGEDTVKNAEASKEALSQQNAEYDRQIKVAKAAGESTVELEKAKQQAIIDTNIQIVKQIEAFVRAGGVLDDEKKKLLTASLEGIKNAVSDQEVIDNAAILKKKEDNQKAIDDAKKQKEKEKEEAEKERVEKVQKAVDLRAEMLKIFQEGKDEEKAISVQAAAETQELLDNQAKDIIIKAKEREASAKETNKIEIELEKEKAQQKRDIEAKSIQATKMLTDMYFAHQLRMAKGNAVKELEIKKKQFKINKAFALGGAIVDGVRSVQAALTQTPPLSYILAALNGVLAVANIAKIAGTQFDDGGGISGGGGDIGGGVSGGSAPAIASPNNTVTKIDDSGQIEKAKAEQPMIKAVVVETDITDKQKRINTIQEGATI